MIRFLIGSCTILLLLVPQSARSAETADLLKTIKSVGKMGEGNAAAQRALKELTKSDADVLPDVLRAFDGANPLAENWLRGAVEVIGDRAVKSGGSLPLNDLEAFIKDASNNPRARTLAFEWVQKVDKERAAKLTPGFLQDPSADLRREAVARLLDEAKKLDDDSQKQERIAVLRKALGGAVDDDQVKAIVGPLKKLGEEVDLQRHFGFLTEWHIVGPFDNKGGKGFDVAYPPETEKPIDLKAVYKGQLGEAKWQRVETEDPYGVVDVAKSLKNYKGSAMYAYARFQAAEAGSVQFRLGTPNAWKLWVNGELVFGREEYHRGMQLDQYVVNAKLKPGRNEILLKILQNEQPQDWAQRYRYQIRVCDGAGSAILPTKDAAAETETSNRRSPRAIE